jgi:hypothetical protein
MKEPADIYRSLISTGNEMVDRAYDYRLLDDATKSVLAQLTIEAKQVEGVSSQAEALSIALTASTYRDHLKACAEASRIAERAKISYYSTRSYADHCRTAEASSRAASGHGT